MTSIMPTVTPHLSQNPIPSKTTLPRYMISPGYIASTGIAVDKETNEQTKVLGVELLNKEKWEGLSKFHQNIINEHRFIYIRLDQENRNAIVELGIHTDYCKKVRELGISQIV